MATIESPLPNSEVGVNFIKQIIEEDLQTGKHSSVVTRFPPEPNGFLHLGHAKSICLNFGLAKEFNGVCHLRFDDTNPEAEDIRYINAIQEDIKWLGFDWGDKLFYASDYFDQLFEWAVKLIKDGKAYVDDQTPEQIRENRGDLENPGVDSPFRNRSVEENLELFYKMKEGKFKPSECVLRAKIDMKHAAPIFRDPILYRIIINKPHPRTGTKWCIYPMYDFAHGQSDSIEGITHSICTLEFIINRPLYEWFQEQLDIPRTRQIEFARLNLQGVVMSKRHLQTLVREKVVRDWDDPRMPTIAAMRRRGYPASAIRNFCKSIGVAKRKNTIEHIVLDNCIQEELHKLSKRRFAILNPLKVVIENFPENTTEDCVAPEHPEDQSFGNRTLPLTRVIYIDRSDFMENPTKDFFRLSVGKEVRLKYAYWIKCESFDKDEHGNITQLNCTYDINTKSGSNPPDGRKVKGTIQWLSADYCTTAELRLYNNLFLDDSVFEDKENFFKHANPNSLEIVSGLIEKNLTKSAPGEHFQFERLGYFTPDYDTTESHCVFNRTLKLLDNFNDKNAEKEKAKEEQRIAREKAAEERKRLKEQREKKQAEKAAKLASAAQ